MKKKCGKCNGEKDVSDFYASKGSIHSWCKECFSESVKKRWIDRKKKAVELMGGECQECGYKKCLAALEFHHKDPNVKEFCWTKMKLYSWVRVIAELKKCIMLCANCHRELHWMTDNEIETVGSSNNNLNRDIFEILPTGKCPTCEDDVYGTKYCSVKCSTFSKRIVKRPSKEKLSDMLSTMSRVAVGKEYGVSDNSIKKWAKGYGIIE